MSARNAVSHHIAVGLTYADLDWQSLTGADDGDGSILIIQNKTGGELSLKFGGGAGVITVANDGMLQFDKGIATDIQALSGTAGNVVVVV